MTPAAYDAWYATPRGRWIGTREFGLLVRLLDVHPGETLLDVGCGTGYFSRRFAREVGMKVTGVDIDSGMLACARDKASEVEFVQADATRLPFTDMSFDHVVAVTSLCFVSDEVRAVREMARVARQRVALGLLNRHSLLWLRKHGAGSYTGARWHTNAQARTLLSNAGLRAVRAGSAIHFSEGGRIARTFESVIPSGFPGGGFIGVAGLVSHEAGGRK